MQHYRFGPAVRVIDQREPRTGFSINGQSMTGNQARNRLVQQQRRNERTNRTWMMLRT